MALTHLENASEKSASKSKSIIAYKVISNQTNAGRKEQASIIQSLQDSYGSQFDKKSFVFKVHITELSILHTHMA